MGRSARKSFRFGGLSCLPPFINFLRELRNARSSFFFKNYAESFKSSRRFSSFILPGAVKENLASFFQKRIHIIKFMKPVYLGIDASTQSMSGIVIDCENSAVLASENINFERDLPSYGTKAGVCSSPENPLEIYSYPLMWLDALDMLLQKIAEKININEISAISGSGQQHASVWLNSSKAFSSLSPSKSLANNIKPYLSREKSPVWMDASTAAECMEMAKFAGGDPEVMQRTGSVMTERFSGAQIRKISKREPRIYDGTRRIHLNSSFLCSIFSASDSPIDFCDGAGMNLMNIKDCSWDQKMLSACAQELDKKLPSLASPNTVVGNVGEYFSKKYGFNGNAKVVIFTGDNPSSLVGLGASAENTAAISLGTSDTYFCSIKNFSPIENAHIFRNPAGAYMGLACFRNGSLARDKFRQLMNVDWKFFDETAFENYAPLCDGKFILPFFIDEISPKISSNGPRYVGLSPKDSKETQIRTFIEGQAFNIYLQARRFGETPKKIILTGGASKSQGIAQTFADVFNSEIYGLKASQNSAALGAAIRAASCDFPIDSLAAKFCPLIHLKSPRPEAAKVYSEKLETFSGFLH